MSLTALPNEQWKRIDPGDERLARGYKAQFDRMGELIARGARHIGWKIGINNPSARARLGLQTSGTGYLTDATVFSAGAQYSLAGATLPGVEPEIAIYLGRDVAAGASLKSIENAIASLGLALEIIDINMRFDDIAAVLERNVFHRAVLFGKKRVAYDPGILRTIVVQAGRNGSAGSPVSPEDVLGDIRELVRFVADTLGSVRGRSLLAGERIISGVITPSPIFVKPGDRVSVDMRSLGAEELSFTS